MELCAGHTSGEWASHVGYVHLLDHVGGSAQTHIPKNAFISLIIENKTTSPVGVWTPASVPRAAEKVATK